MRSEPTPPLQGWTANVAAGVYIYNEAYGPERRAANDPEAAVFLCYNGEARFPFDYVSLKDPDFYDKITTLKATVAEVAAVLNAVGAE